MHSDALPPRTVEGNAPTPGVTIAIDGPAGSGKSTVSRRVAEALGGGMLDTGAMYRAVTWWALEHEVPFEDREAIADIAAGLELEIGTDPAGAVVIAGGEDVTAAIRTERISQQVSAVATNTLVRPILQARQRDMLFAAAAQKGACVAEGRDITTVVYPDADLRILLTASPEARLRRRAGDMAGKLTEDQLRDQVLRRDRDDSKLVDFQTAADGVQLLDTSDMTLAEVVDAITDLAEESRP